MIKLPHCAALARQLGERPTGTASRIRSVLLIEHTGPWAVDVRERVLTECFGPSAPEWMDELHVRRGLRALVIRRPGRNSKPERPSVFAGGCEPGRRWLERLPVDRRTDLADLDLTEVALGPGGLGEPVADPLLLVCVHGRKDACCAMLGRPVADALAAEYPDQTWQCTHFGGDRWAGNLLVAPHGFMYGQLRPASVMPVAAAAQRGEVELDNLRGRVGIDPFAQVAEIAIRERTGLTGLDDTLAGVPDRQGDDQAVVEVRTATGALFRVRVRHTPLGVHGHSVCSGEARPHRFEVLDIEMPVPA
ncbi:sucrase ferredoxin [Pseudonocardia acaciae]|uniref:sucrase ferredoxin n=1 Tax=Pseudonocardia acaciae TaxID=551276 RepID=UPI0012ED0BB3|nr:sucrase ferredoxin [Pseudonocardia acaciae]